MRDSSKFPVSWCPHYLLLLDWLLYFTHLRSLFFSPNIRLLTQAGRGRDGMEGSFRVFWSSEDEQLCSHQPLQYATGEQKSKSLSCCWITTLALPDLAAGDNWYGPVLAACPHFKLHLNKQPNVHCHIRLLFVMSLTFCWNQGRRQKETWSFFFALTPCSVAEILGIPAPDRDVLTRTRDWKQLMLWVKLYGLRHTFDHLNRIGPEFVC